LKQDSVFLPGTGTIIGATHWVAYAMTRGTFVFSFVLNSKLIVVGFSGRVWIISRSSGDRTLLQLPQTFFYTSSVIDMAVYGNRLARVTSDGAHGGFVVWELPEVVTDDVP
jgi:hypothetical protein